MTSSAAGATPTGVAAPYREGHRPPGTTRYISTSSFSLNNNQLSGEEGAIRLDRQALFAAKKNFEKRARVKHITSALMVEMATVDSPLRKSYWNTYHCSTILQKQGEHLTSKYCKNRWCLVCSRIRTAQLIKQYLPTVNEWAGKQFVTLTVPNCPADQLEETIKEMKAKFDRIRKSFDNAFRKGKRENPLVGIRKLEVTYNSQRKDYHPHFHLIIRNAEVAHALREEWLYAFPNASWDAQNVKPADNNSVLELFKYFTKLVSSHSAVRTITVEPLDQIFRAVAGQRTFQAYNLRTTKETTDEEADAIAEKLAIDALFEWQQAATDWVEVETGELLTGYTPSAGLRRLVETGIVHEKGQPPS